MSDGLRHKYDVVKAGTSDAVDGCFVLRPDRDPAARAALLAYALATDDERLRADLRLWVSDIQEALAPDRIDAMRLKIMEQTLADTTARQAIARRELEAADFAVRWARQAWENSPALDEVGSTEVGSPGSSCNPGAGELGPGQFDGPVVIPDDGKEHHCPCGSSGYSVWDGDGWLGKGKHVVTDDEGRTVSSCHRCDRELEAGA